MKQQYWIVESCTRDSATSPKNVQIEMRTPSTVMVRATMQEVRATRVVVVLDRELQVVRVMFRGTHALACGHELMAHVLRSLADLDTSGLSDLQPQLLDGTRMGGVAEVRLDRVAGVDAASSLLVPYFGDEFSESLP